MTRPSQMVRYESGLSPADRAKRLREMVEAEAAEIEALTEKVNAVAAAISKLCKGSSNVDGSGSR